ncbi:DUF3300 domain-containing protein [Amaricoccus solimangrovi]|uniref:DUF3300 domain-containing protein n=1 Tax=Amaricoccus solimangrovi TaxID=2589815 RepID=A0A501WFJ9_9RHOB|nr:DUF3300 domain-containing protein [Amaricoccus solimangrovi]TPE48188.1 DUF3300 domain-containing protein [Amaricoccus solimangrovi]
MPRFDLSRPAARAAFARPPLWLVLAAALLPGTGSAQDEAPAPDQPAAAEIAAGIAVEAADTGEAPPETDVADLLTDDELDDLAAPIALYPDALLAQVLVAATYPLDVMKADRFLDDHGQADQKERARLVEAEDWDESVRTLAAGFPDVVGRMADEVEWTEDLGDAMLAQPDDLFDSVQRLRAQARAVGNLASNEAQTVEAADEHITIAPADPDVVYVPSYDPAMAFTTPTTQPTAVYDPGISFTSVLTTGAIAFGSAMLIDEIFDDDDDWDDYWRGPPRIDWDEDAVFPRRSVNVNGDVNIDVDRGGHRLGDRDGDQRRRAEQWKPDAARRDAARDRLDAKAKAPGGPGRPAPRGGADRAAARDKAEARLKARSGGKAPAPAKDRPALSKAKAKAGARGSDHARAASALKPGGAGDGVARAKSRAGTSLKQSPRREPKAIAKAPAAKKKVPPKKPPKKTSALRKPDVSAARSRASIKRGGKHRH